MSNQTLRIVIGIVFLIHGIGHVQGILSALGVFNSDTWHSRSWLLTDESTAKVVALVIWVVSFVGFILVAAGVFDFLVPQAWVRPMAVVLAVISLVGIVLFWNGFAFIFNKVGAIAVNVAALVAVLIAHWPSEDVIP